MTTRRPATLELPPLDAGEALRLVHLLNALQRGLWMAHGPEMSELLIDRHIAGDASQLDLFDADADLPF